jgi:hypothetical protein
MKKSRSNQPPRSDAGSFNRKEHKPRQSHSWQKEASRIEKDNAKFGPLDGGGKSNIEYSPEGQQEYEK